MPDERTDDSLVAEFERLGRRAGAELREAVPPGEPAAIERTVVRRKRTKTGLITAGVVAVVVLGAAVLTRAPGSERVRTVPSEAPSPTSTEPGAGATPKARLVIPGPGGDVGWIAISDDERTGASTTDAGWVFVWDTATGEVRRTIAVEGDVPLDQVALSPDGRSVAVLDREGEERFWAVGTGEAAPSFAVSWARPEGDGVPPETFTSADGEHQIELGRFGPVTMVEPGTGEVLATLERTGTVMPYAAVFSADGSRVAVKFGDHVEVWSTTTYESVARFDVPEYRSTADRLVFFADGRRLAFTGEDQVIVETVPDAAPAEASGRLVLDGAGRDTDAPDGNGGYVAAFDVSADGRTVATASEAGTVRIWDAASGRELRSFPLGGMTDIDRFSFSPDGERLSARSYDGEIATWHVADGTTAPPFETGWATPDEASEGTPLVSPDGSLRLELGRYGPVDLVDVDDGTVVRTLRGGGSPRPYVGRFSADGSMVAVKFTDEVWVWRVSSGEQIARYDLPDYEATAEHLTFTPDGERLAFTVEDAVIIETLP